MKHIIGSPCEGVCDTSCVHVYSRLYSRPIDISGGGKEVDGMSKEELEGKMLYIGPLNECIDYENCLLKLLAVNAIFEDEETSL